MSVNGFYLINKPIGITSHDVVYRLRKVTGEKTIGHAGTLDPFAEGLLILAVGREYTKRISEFAGLDKEYIGEIRLGQVSNTYDREGEITDVSDTVPTTEQVVQVLSQFRGNIKQIPPAFSAKKIGGKKAYDLARAGKEINLEPVELMVHELELVSYEYPILKIRTKVSKGTYIRSLAHDIGQALVTGGFLQSLVRTKIDKYELENAIALDSISSPDDLKDARIEEKTL